MIPDPNSSRHKGAHKHKQKKRAKMQEKEEKSLSMIYRDGKKVESFRRPENVIIRAGAYGGQKKPSRLRSLSSWKSLSLLIFTTV